MLHQGDLSSLSPGRLVILGAKLAASLVASLGLAFSLVSCSEPVDPSKDQTVVLGEIFGQDFSQSSAGYTIDTSAAVNNIVIRIAPRKDVCEAVTNPSDDVSPSLIITTAGDQAQEYDVVDLDTDPNQSPQATATMVLQIRDDSCTDPDNPEQPPCLSDTVATAGKIVIEEAGKSSSEALVRGAFGANFDADNSIEGHFIAKLCERIF